MAAEVGSRHRACNAFGGATTSSPIASDLQAPEGQAVRREIPKHNRSVPKYPSDDAKDFLTEISRARSRIGVESPTGM